MIYDDVYLQMMLSNLNHSKKIDRYFEMKMAMDIFQSNNINLACLYNTRRNGFFNATSFRRDLGLYSQHFVFLVTYKSAQ
jgi:hypothetical protein